MGTAVAEHAVAAPPWQRQIEVEFLYLDLETCARCLGTAANLETALDEVSRILAAAGANVAVHETHVTSEEQARALNFVSSPTIRVNGRDVAFELRESRCRDCEDCACNGTVDCRIWVWHGHEYEEAPAAMIVDALLREIYAGAPQPPPTPVVADVPANLQRYFAGVAKQAAAPASCCDTATQASCCEPAAKASCCGEATNGGCGCQ